jgi:AcrR family transcriptional regulator
LGGGLALGGRSGESARRDRPHVCVLAEGPDDGAGVILPFLRAGLEGGQRVVHYVDAADRGTRVAQLQSSGADVDRLVKSGELGIYTWQEIHATRFRASRMTAVIRRQLAASAAGGFSSTYIAGDMAWPLEYERVPGELVDFEGRLDDILRRASASVICVYDARRVDTGLAARLFGVHPQAMVGGVLTSLKEPAQRFAPRARVLDAAAELFHLQGIRASGVDGIIEAAGVAKASFYRHFRSKEELVVAWLEDPRTRWFDLVRREAEAGAATRRNPRAIVASLFTAVEEWLEADGFRGCPYLNTAAEITDRENPALPIVDRYLQDVQDYLRNLLASNGYTDADALAAQVQALLFGGISLGAARRSTEPLRAAAVAADSLLRRPKQSRQRRSARGA